METGTVKFFNESKGFGFITQEDGKEIFGMNQVQAIMFLCGAKSMKAVKGKSSKYINDHRLTKNRFEWL